MVIFNCVDLFQDAGTNIDDNMAAIIVATMMVLATGVSAVLVDRAGRKLLLIISELFMAVSLCLLGLFFNLKEIGPTGNIGWLPLVGLCVFIVAFSLGMGPVPWILMGELLPQNTKGEIIAVN